MSNPNHENAGAEVLARCLVREGVERVFALPGEENIELIEALRKTDIELIVTRHEQHAAFMAAAYGRLTGRAGVCLATLGPGATNLFTGLAHAQLCGFPVVAITGQKPLRGNEQGRFQLIDVVGMLRPVSKRAATVEDADAVAAHVRRAFAAAESERPGVAHIELPQDVAQAVSARPDPLPRADGSAPVAPTDAIARAAELLARSERPLALVSSGASRDGICAALADLSTTAGLYVIATQMGKGVLDDDHERSLFCVGLNSPDHAAVAFDEADLVLTVGYDLAEYPPETWNPEGDQRILHIDTRPADPGARYAPCFELVGDIAASLGGLRERFAALEAPPRDSGVHRRLRAFLETHLSAPLETHLHPVPPSAVVSEVQSAMGREGIVSLDNGVYKLTFAREYRAHRRDSVLLDNALATMGAGLGTAMSAKIVYPDRPVLAVAGDGGFLMNVQDLETSVRLGLDLVVLVLRDGAYGFIRHKQRKEGFEDFGMSFGNPDFVQLAESFGARGLRVEAGDRLRDVLGEALRLGGTVLVDCAVDYSENEALDRDLAAEARRALEGSEA